MAKLGEREHVLLGYTHRDPFGNHHHHQQPQYHRNSDVDFADVFGGPPRRSFYERRRSREESLDARARPRTPSTEKPSFGELGSPARRRLLGDDFYDDIFPGSESDLSMLGKLDRDPFPSSPSSRIASPNRPVFVGGSSLPPHLSFPMTKLAKGVEHPPFGSPTHHPPSKIEDDNFSFPHSPNASKAASVHDDLRSSGHSFYRQSPLASQLSRGTIKSSETFSKGSQSERYATSLEGYINNNQFHFSIYRWAGKGVSLGLSSLSEETNVAGRYSRLPEVVIQSVEYPSDDDDDDYMSASPGISNNQTETNKNKVINDIFSEIKHGVDLSFREYNLSELDPNYSSKSYTGNAGSETLNEHEKEDGGQQDATDGFKIKQQKQKRNSEDVGTNNTKKKDIPVSLEEKMNTRRVKGRVKDFIKIFNIEGSPKRKGIFESGDTKSKEKDGVKSEADVQVSTPAAEANDKVKAVPPHNEGTFGTYYAEVNEMLKNEGISPPYTSSNDPLTKDPSPERSNTSGLNPTAAKENNNVSAYNAEEYHFEDLEGCLVEELPQTPFENQQSASQREEIEIANRKIREWSKGKEGNIRSLLSTLQYVLWSGCGWKPVPLVDIIEGPSVKRAYQKALLYLHPDKLQQRGAAEHQKYIAEKVFDILQEAWDQFNSTSGVF
ncbi:J domain-containing protein required for chloroplast accumulation response 1-like [Zingiber officinale]|uniref:J domain-containing protein required for chloroplast accumulation response 1-like n=1 Tax=Zingiber officinale TaxID=94328 RepID=UPI001C4D71F2|nr:J domain-containing protein required for chloroplast accumulation response 1-like [Zingiber officinale]